VNYRNNSELQDRLAAEYVLGTLRGPARLRFKAWMREDAALARAVREWEARLSPMAEALPPVPPPKRVWKAIENRITAPASAPAARPTLWESLGFWRGWGLVTSGLAAALAVAIVVQKPEAVEIVRTVEVVKTVESPPNRMQPSYVAMLEDTGGGMKLMAYAARQSDELWFRMEGMEHKPGHSYELWALPAKPGEPPKSLGVLPARETGTIKLAAAADQTLSDFPKLAISVEPEGGSKTGTPTGPVVAKGDCMKFW
jgi:anti-sigma-K factor RskA